MKKRIGYGIVGAGGRAESLAGYLVANSDIFLKGIFDPSAEHSNAFKAKYGTEGTVCYASYEELLDDSDIGWVMVFSPNYCHKDHIISAFERGKHVFAEKPIATTIEDCVAINETHKNSEGLMFATGFVLRYSPLYRKTKSLLESGIIGKIVSVEANENITPEHGGAIMTGWRRDKKFSGSHILEKCCHDMDLLNWYIDDLPSRVASFGGTNIFVPENAGLLTKFKSPPGKSSIYLNWDLSHQDSDDPFNSEKDLIDNQVAILEYRNQVSVSFRATSCNAIPERRIYFTGTEGNLTVECYSGQLVTKRIGYQEPMEVYDFGTPEGHAGGDIKIVEQLIDSMLNNTPPACSGNEGLLSAIVSLSIEQARVERCMVDLEPVWQKLGF